MHSNTLQLLSSSWPPRVTSVIILALFGWWLLAYVLPQLGNTFDETTAPITARQTDIHPEIPAKLSLKNLDLFGTPEKSRTISNSSEAEQTTLKLTLRGILATDDPKQGIAQIQNTSNIEKHFSVSDSVFGLATLEEIHIDRVILLHNGRYETLLLPEKFLNVKHFSAEKLKLERKKIATDYRKLFLSRNGMELRKLFGFDTAWKNGGFAGFIVKALGDKGLELMEKFGVEDGDLITVVNGLRFSESLQASQQLVELKTATSVDIIIERAGQEIPLHIEFDAPVQDIAELPADNMRSTISSSPPESDALNPSTATTYSNSSVTGAGSSNTSSTTAPAESSLPQKSFAEKEGAEEYIRMQRERTTAPDTAVEYDH